MKSHCLCIFALILLVTTSHAALVPEKVKTMPHAAIEKALPSEHPSTYYSYAARLFAEGKKDEAVFWFYAGQIRYRVHLKANPTLDPSGDPALFSSLSAIIGRQINEYAGGDPKMMVGQIDRALAWDAKNRNGFTSKRKFKKEYEEIRTGLTEMKVSIEKNMDKLLEQRRKAGLEVRSQ